MKKNWIAWLLIAALGVSGPAAGTLAEAWLTVDETEAPAVQAAVETVPVLELPAAEGGTVTGIPIDQDSRQTAIAPKAECYLVPEGAEDPTGYADPSITVNIGWGRFMETNYVYARVKIASASQLRTLLASPLSSSGQTPGHDLAERVKAVIAINGDFCGGDGVARSALMRQGKMLRLHCDGNFDVLVIDQAGDLEILLNAKDEDVQAVADKAVNIFTFGPALIQDGEPLYGRNRVNLGRNKQAQRMAICQTGPLEYLLITSEGPEDPPDCNGLTMDQFTEMISTHFPEVRTAYNLDGGSSSTMVFRKGGKNWVKINAPNNGKRRPLKDIIYFASAWETP